MKPKTWVHPKFADLRTRLNIGIALATGILENLWYLASTFDDENGRLPHTAEQLEAWLQTGLDPEELIAALVDTGWLDSRDGGLFVHDWADHRPKYVNDRIRIRNSRHRSDGENCSLHSRTVADSREQSPPSPSPSPPPSPSPSEKKTSSPGGDGSSSSSKNDYSRAFEQWWQHYPRKVGKKAAYKAYKAAVKLVGHETLLATVIAFKGSDKARGDFVPNPATWLNEGRYEDDPAAWQERNGKGQLSLAEKRKGLYRT